MLTPLVHITMPEDDGEDRHFAPVVIALDFMCKLNEWHIRRSLKRAAKGEGNPIVPLYASGVVYKEDPPGEENWGDLFYVLACGHGDCDRLVAWRVGELRAAGVKAEPVVKWQQIPKEIAVGALGYPSKIIPDQGLSMIHCCVRFPDGHIEDPSKILGMGGEYTSKL